MGNWGYNPPPSGVITLFITGFWADLVGGVCYLHPLASSSLDPRSSHEKRRSLGLKIKTVITYNSRTRTHERKVGLFMVGASIIFDHMFLEAASFCIFSHRMIPVSMSLGFFFLPIPERNALYNYLVWAMNQNPGCLGYRDYMIQFYKYYNKALWGSLLNQPVWLIFVRWVAQLKHRSL